MPGELPVVMHAAKAAIAAVTVFVDDQLLDAKLALELARTGERLSEHRHWRDTPAPAAPYDLRIHRVRDVGMTSELLRADVHGDHITLRVDRSLMAPELPDLLVQASMEIGRNVT